MTSPAEACTSPTEGGSGGIPPRHSHVPLAPTKAQAKQFLLWPFFCLCFLFSYSLEDAGQGDGQTFLESRSEKNLRKRRYKKMKKVPERNRSSHFVCINGALIVHSA